MNMVTIIDRVRTALEERGSDCPLEDVGGLCPELTWNQVFLAIDFLSRTGEVRMELDRGRTYKVRASQPTHC